jgi:hypothetical protein
VGWDFGVPVDEGYQAGWDQLEAGEKPGEFGVAAGPEHPMAVTGSGESGQPVGDAGGERGVEGGVGQYEKAARGQGVNEAFDQLIWAVGVVEEVQDRGEEQPDRLGEVESAPQLGVGEEIVGGTEVASDVGGGGWRGADDAGTKVGDDHGVVIDVDHPRVGSESLGEVVHAGGDGKTGPEVQELSETFSFGQQGHGPVEESSILSRGQANRGKYLSDPVPGFPVGGEVVFSTEPVVVTTTRVHFRGVDAQQWVG